MSNFDYITIEPQHQGYGDKWGVFGHGVYPRSSVLAGQPQRAYLAAFDTAEAAQAEWPHADVLDHSSKVWRGDTLVEMSGLPDCPPGWFDPMDAGETW